jgi:hypothetical protein
MNRDDLSEAQKLGVVRVFHWQYSSSCVCMRPQYH